MSGTAIGQVIHSTGRVLPETSALLRDHVRPAARRSAHYLDRYDRHTLYFDCVYLPEDGSYLFTAPRLLNLWKPFRAGLSVDGKPVGRVRRRTWLRYEQVTVRAPAGRLRLNFDGDDQPVVARPSLAPAFAGLNCLLTVNKNNDLDWIANWAAYHVAAQGANGVILFDNGSTAYGVQDICAALSGLAGLKTAVVYAAPYPYGPSDKSSRFEVSPRFFQSAMLNIARRDALSGARAVLNIDIDEVVRRTDGGPSAFDLATQNPLGMVMIDGTWAYPGPEATGPVGHAAHVWQQVPPRGCNPKWCAVPGGWMSRLGWSVHQIGPVRVPPTTAQTQVQLLHCRGTSTGWKSQRFKTPKTLEHSAELARFMARNFPCI
ncbi:hypothetical protein [Pseudoruegeria sp. SK021]|uniref:hypothetical protein n=1 Tax=Pseudoruegeria sp. SK021 TaxID=1933035 RepID=UPI000A24DEAE|nr:hypothetical protein [Pseudoruegeria sp. SK021]OSP55561.1 hypothetical protein BV911_06750 [Pseudoruegeria sp. SK021]